MNTKAMLKLIKSPIKTHIDHHNGKLHQVSSIMINHPSIIHIISLTLTLLQCSSLKTT